MRIYHTDTPETADRAIVSLYRAQARDRGPCPKYACPKYACQGSMGRKNARMVHQVGRCCAVWVAFCVSLARLRFSMR